MKLTVAPASAEYWSTAGPPDRTAAQIRSLRRMTAALWAVTLLAALAGLALTLIAWGDLKVSDGISNLNNVVAAVAYATLGVLIIRRAANLVGWIMLAVGAGIAFFVLASAYAVTGVAAHPGTLPAARLAGTLSECIFPRGLPHRLHVPPVPDGEAAIAALAPGRRGRLAAGGPDHGRAGRVATAAASARAGRCIAGLPESAGR